MLLIFFGPISKRIFDFLTNFLSATVTENIAVTLRLLVFFSFVLILHLKRKGHKSEESLVSSIRHVSVIMADLKLELTGLNTAIDPFVSLFRYSLTRSYFLTICFSDSSTQIEGFYGECAFF